LTYTHLSELISIGTSNIYLNI